MIELTVSEIEGTAPRTVTPGASVAAAAEALRRTDTPALPVLEDGTVVGILTESDIVALVAETGERPSVREIMSTPVETVEPSATVSDAAARMRATGVKHLPIVDDDVYLGLLTVDDLAPYCSRRRLDIDWNDTPLDFGSGSNGELTAGD